MLPLLIEAKAACLKLLKLFDRVIACSNKRHSMLEGISTFTGNFPEIIRHRMALFRKLWYLCRTFYLLHALFENNSPRFSVRLGPNGNVVHRILRQNIALKLREL